MNTKELTAQLVAIHAALVEKIEAQPFMSPTLSLNGNGDWTVDIWLKFKAGGDYGPFIFKGERPEASIAAAFAYVAAMPDPEQAAKQAWQKSLGKVIDEGHALNLPDDVMQPLRAGSQAMTENLLAGPKA